MASSIDLVLPFYNPVDGWANRVLKSLADLAESCAQYEFKLILVDDGSEVTEALEEGKQLLKEEGVKHEVITLPSNAGKGQALRQGMLHSEAPFTIFTDIDFPYDTESMAAIIQCLESGEDVALGFREQDYYVSVPWFRKGLSVLFRMILKGVLKSPITDTQCGLKGMSSKGREVFLKTKINRFLVDMEFIKLSMRNATLRVKPVTVHLRQDVQFSTMGIKVLITEGINFLRILFR